MKEVTKEVAPTPFNFITRQCLIAGGNMHLIRAVGNFLTIFTKKVKLSIFLTLIVIYQRQPCHPIKSVRKLIKRREELNLPDYFQKIQIEADLAGFLKLFWATLLNIFNQEVEDEDFSELMAIFDVTTVANQLSPRHAYDFMALVIENLVQNKNIKIPKTLQRILKAVILRFGPKFDFTKDDLEKFAVKVITFVGASKNKVKEKIKVALSHKFEFYNQCEDSILIAFLVYIDHLKANGIRAIVNCLVEHVTVSITNSSNTYN
uniref:Uncharacterized protein n=1 Tax=Panagrolaimus sp. ES5 TaxID=591445 RepID=A0AC34F5W6_9BILA